MRIAIGYTNTFKLKRNFKQRKCSKYYLENYWEMLSTAMAEKSSGLFIFFTLLSGEFSGSRLSENFFRVNGIISFQRWPFPTLTGCFPGSAKTSTDLTTTFLGRRRLFLTQRLLFHCGGRFSRLGRFDGIFCRLVDDLMAKHFGQTQNDD